MFTGVFVFVLPDDSTNLIVDGKSAVFIQVGKVLGTVVLKIAAFVINALEEEVIGRRASVE